MTALPRDTEVENFASTVHECEGAIHMGSYDEMNTILVISDGDTLPKKVAEAASDNGFLYYGKAVCRKTGRVGHVLSRTRKADFELDPFYNWYIG